MKFFNHKIFRAVVFILLLNFENILSGNFPPISVILIEFVFILIFLFFFLPISYQKFKGKSNLILKVRIILVVLVTVLLNTNQLISKGTIPILHLILSCIMAIFLIYFLIPIWFKNDIIDNR